jgi:squalene cyclase
VRAEGLGWVGARRWSRTGPDCRSLPLAEVACVPTTWRPHPAPPEGRELRNAASDARDRAVAWLLERRRPDATWSDPADVGAFCGAMYVMMLRTTGLIEAPSALEDELRIVRHLADQANGDGTFHRYPGGPTCRQVTRAGALALRLATGLVAPSGRPAEWFVRNPLIDPGLASRCAEVLEQAEQVSRSRPAGRSHSHGLDHWPLVSILSSYVLGRPRLPAWPLRLLAGRMGGGNGAGPGLGAASLSVVLRRATPALALLWNGVLARQGLGGTIDADAAVRRITAQQGANGGWFYIAPTTALNAMALREAGVPLEDPRIARAWRFLRDRLHPAGEGGAFVDPALNDLWCTAHGLRTYLQTPGHRATDRPIVASLTLLLDSQNADGGFSYATGSENDSDTDTTALVLRTLAEARRTTDDREGTAGIARALGAGVEYLLRMQNRSGGFGAWGRTFVRGGRGPFSLIQQSLFDAPSADLTARVVEALTDCGLTSSDEPLRRALAFLLRSQCGDGVWWSRWWAGYLSGTGDVLSACGHLGAPGGANLRAPSPGGSRWPAALARATRFMLHHQNEDGGWGETVRSDLDRGAAGVGPSNPVHTAHVLRALLRAGRPPTCPHVRRGVAYLLAAVGRDGCWEYRDAVFSFLSGSLYYPMPQTACWLPVQALSEYLRASGER